MKNFSLLLWRRHCVASLPHPGCLLPPWARPYTAFSRPVLPCSQSPQTWLYRDMRLPQLGSVVLWLRVFTQLWYLQDMFKTIWRFDLNSIWEYGVRVGGATLWGHINPASIATLAQRWPNVDPYVGPTSAHQRWANVDLSIGPTLAQRLHANVGPTLCQHLPNVGTLTLGQRWHNVMPMVVCQRCTNIGPTEAALLAFCEGNPSVTNRSPVEQTVELSNQWFETPMWSTSM